MKNKTTRRLYECRSRPPIGDLTSEVTLPVKFVRNSVFKKFGTGILLQKDVIKCEFREDWVTNGNTSFKGVNKFVHFTIV